MIATSISEYTRRSIPDPIDFPKITVGNFRDRPPFEQMVDYAKEGFLAHYRTIGDPDSVDRKAVVYALLDLASDICHEDGKELTLCTETLSNLLKGLED